MSFALRDKGGGKRRHIVAHDVYLGEITGKHLLRAQNISQRNQKHILCPQRCCAQGKTGKHLWPQHCVLVCHHLKRASLNLSDNCHLCVQHRLFTVLQFTVCSLKSDEYILKAAAVLVLARATCCSRSSPLGRRGTHPRLRPPREANMTMTG